MSSNSTKSRATCSIDWDIFPMPPEIWEQVASDLDLSSRHKAIVERILHGRRRKQIVRDLDSTDGSIGEHFKRIYNYLKVSGRDDLVLLIFRLAMRERYQM